MQIEEATPKARGTPREHRLLIVVDDTCSAPNLCAGVRRYADAQAIEAYVIAPARGTAATQWYRDDEAAHADAMRRLRTCLRCLRHAGFRVSGELGDPNAVQAITDALGRFPADEIVLITAARRPSGWLRQSAIAQAHTAFTQPITHVVMPPTTSGGPNARLGNSR